jgi:hypothetical protein
MRRSAYGCRGWQEAASRGALLAALAAAMPAWADEGSQLMALGPQALPAAEGRPSRLSLTVTEPPPGIEGQDVGVQWSQRLTRQHSVDITAWRRTEPDAMTLIQQQRGPTYGARLEFRLKPSSRFVADYKSLGLQLDNGGKISLRRKNGSAALVYRQQF